MHSEVYVQKRNKRPIPKKLPSPKGSLKFRHIWGRNEFDAKRHSGTFMYFSHGLFNK